jgi:hypothetical protein
MTTSVCLLDWDGTLRKGYVISDWTRFLVELGVVDKRFQELMEEHFPQYEGLWIAILRPSGLLSHNQRLPRLKGDRSISTTLIVSAVIVMRS